MSERSLRLALAAFAALRTPTKITNELTHGGRDRLERIWLELSPTIREWIEVKADSLAKRGINAVMFGDSDFPTALVLRGRPASPIIFYMGDLSLAQRPGIGMCGSRAVSQLGIKAARNCGYEVSRRGMVVISGYARGVDTEAHLAALRDGGSTVIVLAEGFDHFRVKRTFTDDFDPTRVLVLSQFPPSQPWQAHAAMARNALIFGLGRALVVIEAGAKGGTLAAGEGALRIGRPLLVLDFGHNSPQGNQMLIERGGRPVTSVRALGEVIDGLQPLAASHQIDELPFAAPST